MRCEWNFFIGEKPIFELCFMFCCFVREVATQHKVMLSRDMSEIIQ